MAGGSDHNNKLNLVIAVFGREFRLFACQIVLIVFLGSCCLFIIYYTWMLFLSYSLLSRLSFSLFFFFTHLH